MKNSSDLLYFYKKICRTFYCTANFDQTFGLGGTIFISKVSASLFHKQIWQECRNCRNICNQQQVYDHNHNKWYDSLYNFRKLCFSYTTGNKEVDSKWRCNKSDCQVYNHDDSKMNRIYTYCCNDWKENRSQDHDRTESLHEASYKKENYIEDRTSVV